MHFLKSPWEPWQQGKGWGHVTRLIGPQKHRRRLQTWNCNWLRLQRWACLCLKGLSHTDGRRKTWIYEFGALADPWGQITASRIFFNKAWCSCSRLATLLESCGSCGAGCTGFEGICRVFWFDFDGPTRGLHDFARAESITFINSPIAEVSHDFAWHAKCNGEKMHNFESCHTPPYRGGWGGTPLLSISVGTGVYTTSRPVGHTFRELWQCPLVDGSASKDPQTGLNKVGFAVTTEFEVVKSGKLPSNYSAQGAELVALTEACKLMADKCVTIYTDLRYALGVTHDFGALWKHRHFLKSDGHPILNASLVSKLLEAILLPDKVAICKCAAHTNDKRFISTGNARADTAAKAAAAQETKKRLVL